jgi:2-octaprenyl-6-methoxyphenol hydroxylase
LRARLLRRLAACAHVELVAPDEVVETRRDPGRAELVLKSGRRIATRLVASAEGRFGTMREDAGIGARAWSYDQVAIVLVARHERPHRGVAQEKFLAGRPLRHPADARWRDGEHRSSIVWSERADLAKRLLALDAPRFQAEFARRFGDYLGHVEPTVRAGGIRWDWSMPSATSTRAWCWWATPRTASIPSPAKAIISACATSRPWSRF